MLGTVLVGVTDDLDRAHEPLFLLLTVNAHLEFVLVRQVRLECESGRWRGALRGTIGSATQCS
jgi:hypothetical protein